MNTTIPAYQVTLGTTVVTDKGLFTVASLMQYRERLTLINAEQESLIVSTEDRLVVAS